MKRSQLFPIVFLSLTALTLAACGGAEPAEEAPETLTVAIWGGFWGDAYKAAAIDSYVEETGIDVELVTNVTDSLALLATETEKDEPLYDLMWLTDPEFRIASNGDLLAPVNYENITHADDLYDVGKAEFGVSSEIGAWGIAYNTNLVDEAPTSWSDLLDPEIAPMVGIIPPDFGGGSVFDLTILAIAAGGTQDDTETLGIETAKTLAENGARFGEFGDILTLFANEEIAYAILYHQEPIYFQQDGMAVEFVLPEEGAYPVGAWMAMPANLPAGRKAAAEEFMSFVVSPDAQTAIAEGIYSGPINSAAVLDDELATLIHPYGEDEIDALVTPDWDYTMENLESWLDLWQREVVP